MARIGAIAEGAIADFAIGDGPAGAGAASITGTLSVTLGSLSLTSTGTVAVTGSFAATLGSLSFTSTGTVAVAGSFAATLGGLSLSVSGTVAANSATLSVTLGGLTLAAAGTISKAVVVSPPASSLMTDPRDVSNLPAGIILTRETSDALWLTWQANGFAALSPAQFQATTGPAPAWLTSLPRLPDTASPIEWGH